MARKENRKTTDTGSRYGQSTRAGDSPKKPSRGREVEPIGTGATATATLGLSHDQIADRARQIWEQRGRPYGEDERNWREAERQLKKEMGIE